MRPLKPGSLRKIIIFLTLVSFIASFAPAQLYAQILSDTLRTSSARATAVKDEIAVDLLRSGKLPYVVTYADPRSERKETAGGKCAQLAWAYNRGIPNPLGFSITVEAVREYYRYNPKLIEMIKDARNLDINDAKKRAETALRIQNFMMKETKLPPAVFKAVSDDLVMMSRVLGYEEDEMVPVAYRGSGVIEDFEGAIPWFKKTIGAQPGQGTTLLNKRGFTDIEPSVIEVIAGLFNDQIFVYRDVQIFFDFVSKMRDVSEYNKLILWAKKYGFNVAASRLENENSPGYVNLRKMIEEIEAKEPGAKEQYKWGEKLEKSANDILEPMNFVTGIAVLEMADSLFSGTAFTSHLGTGFDGSTFAKKTKGLFPKKRGDKFDGYTRYVKINLGTGLGPGIVEGKFQPNIVTFFDITGQGKWVPTEFSVGKKHMSLIYIDKVIDSLAPKFAREQIYLFAQLYADWQNPIKQQGVRVALKTEFNIEAESWIRAMMDLWYFYDKSDKHKATAQEKAVLLKELNVNENEFFTLSHLVKHINKVATSYDTASYMLTSPELASSRLLSDEGYKKLADMIAKVGNLMAQERFEAADKGWRERRDIEFSVVRCNENDTSKYKVKLEHIYDLVTGNDLGEGWVKILHIQNRPINPEKEIQDPDNIIFKKMKVDEDFVDGQGILPIAKNGLVGYGAAEGMLYFVDPYNDLAEQEEEVAKMKDQGKSVIVVLEEMGPEHDPIVEKAGAAIVWRGNDTSHAYIFSLELKIPIVINAATQPGFEGYLKDRMNAVIDGSGGMIYPGDKEIPLLPDNLIIRVDMLPETKVGMIVSTLQSAQEVARLGAKSVLTRMEFLINNVVKIYPQAGWAYDLMTKLDNGQISESGLTPEELKDVAALRQHPEIIEEIRKMITSFPSATEFMAEKMRYAGNALGSIFPILNEMRAYDNKEKEALLYGLIGAKLYLRYDDKNPEFDSPLVGMRGSALMSHPHLKKGFQALNRGVIRSVKDGFKNNAFFFVYLRNTHELKTQLADFERLCQEEGAYPEEIGTMIELGGNLWMIKEVSQIFSDFVAKHKKDGVKRWYISFGTNDLTNSLGKTSRDDKDFTGELKVLQPALINADPAEAKIEVVPGAVYGPKEYGQPFTVTLNDEAAPGVIRFIENATAVVRNMGGHVYLCGQAVSKAINKGDVQTGMKLLSVLDAVGTQSITFVSGAMLDFDTRVSLTRISKDALSDKTPAAKLSDIKKEAENAVLISESVVVEKPQDILKLREGQNKQKIVIMKTTWERKDLEDMGIPWDYLNYAGAILLSNGVKPGTGILAEPGVKSRVKARLIGGATIVSGEPLTIAYGEQAVYKGVYSTYAEETRVPQLRMPKEGMIPVAKPIIRISAGDLFMRRGDSPAAIDIHPLAFALYKANPDAVSQETRAAIVGLIGGEDPLIYLHERFVEYVAAKAQEAVQNNRVPVYTLLRLTRNQLRDLKEGEAIEKTKGKEGVNFDDPQCRLQGGARALNDFWQIFNTEIAAFREVKTGYPAMALQLSAMGTRSQEVIEMLFRALKPLGITPQDQEIGLELTTALDPLQVEDYIKQGIKFFSYNDRELAEALLSVNLNHPDIFSVEGKEAMVKQALEAPVAYIKGIVAENADSGVWVGLNPQQSAVETAVIPAAPVEPLVTAPAERLRRELDETTLYTSESAVYTGTSERLGNFADSIKDSKLEKNSATIILGGNVILENAGAMTSLMRFKGTGNLVVYAQDGAILNALKAMGADEVVNAIISRQEVQQDLAELAFDYAKKGPTVLITSPLDRKGVDLTSIPYGVQLVNLDSPKPEEGKINSMPLAISRAFTAILKNDPAVVSQFNALSQNYAAKGRISGRDLEALNNLASQVCDVPLVELTQQKDREVIEAQIAYQATVGQI